MTYLRLLGPELTLLLFSCRHFLTLFAGCTFTFNNSSRLLVCKNKNDVKYKKGEKQKGTVTADKTKEEINPQHANQTYISSYIGYLCILHNVVALFFIVHRDIYIWMMFLTSYRCDGLPRLLRGVAG